MAQSRDPFGGNLTRRTVVAPADTIEKAASFKEKREELQKAVVDSADRAGLEFELARIKNETAKLQLEYQNLQRQLGVPEATVNAAVPTFGGTTAVLNDILLLGQKTGMDVMPMIRQVLLGQPTLPQTQQQVDPSGVPGALWSSLGKILERSLDPASHQPQVDPKVIQLEERMKTQELLLNRDLSDLKELLKNRAGDKDPNVAAADNIKNIALLMAAIKQLSPTPTPAPLTDSGGELAFKYQDRQWQHEEKKLEAEIQKQQIVATMQVEQQKLEQSKNNLAQIPEMIGAVVAQSLMESSKNKSAAPVQARGASKKEPIGIKLSKSKSVPHGAITIKCPPHLGGCNSDVSFITSAKQANCINCGTVFDIQLIETEGGPTSVEAEQAPPNPEVTQEKPADSYLFTRGA